MDDLQTTGVSADAGSAAEGALSPVASPSDVATSVTTTDQTTLQPADASADLEAIISGIPADDTDLKPTDPHYQAVVAQRGQLRTLSSALKELQPLQGYSELGPLPTIKPKVELANLLYSPMVDASGKPVIDPATQTPYVTTAPAYDFFDKNSPGMGEQLLADGLDHVFTTDTGAKVKGSMLVLDYWDKRYPGWWKNRYGSQMPTVTGAVTPEELAEIPSEYHAAYRNIPADVRNAWSAFDKSTQTKMLEDYKRDIDRSARDAADAEAAKEAEARNTAALQAHIATKQREYFATIRQERYNTLSQTLARQVTFSDDAATNSIMHGALGAVLANLTDPDVDFIGKEQVLKPLGLTLDQKFYAALNRYYTSAANKVAYEVAGDAVQAAANEAECNAAADQLSARLAIIALEVAKKMGAKQAAAAATLATSLNGATTVRPTPGTSTAPSQTTGTLPANMRPGSPEALAEIARQTGFVT